MEAKKIVNDIIKYNSIYGINFSEIMIIFNKTEKELYEILEKGMINSRDNAIIKQMYQIIQTKGEIVDKDRLEIAQGHYFVEKRRAVYIHNLLKRQNEDGYKFTKDDLRNITLYRLEYRISQKQIKEMFPNLANKALYNYEQSLPEGTIKNEIMYLNSEYDSSFKAVRMKR